MVEFHELCRTARSSVVHKIKSLSMIGYTQLAAVSSRWLTIQMQNNDRQKSLTTLMAYVILISSTNTSTLL